MSNISGISSSLGSLLTSELLNSSQAGSGQGGSTSGSVNADIVSLLNGSSGSDNSLYSMLSGSQGSGSDTSIYDILLSAENANLMENSPALAQALISAEQTQTTSGATSDGSTQSETTGAQLLQDLQGTNLLTMSPDTLMSMLQSDIESQSGASATGSQVNQTV